MNRHDAASLLVYRRHMGAMSLREAATRLQRSERTVRRMVERGELQGKFISERGRYRWTVTLPEAWTLPVAVERSDVVAMLERIEAKLDQLLAAQSTPAETLPVTPRVRWWQRLGSVFTPWPFKDDEDAPATGDGAQSGPAPQPE